MIPEPIAKRETCRTITHENLHDVGCLTSENDAARTRYGAEPLTLESCNKLDASRPDGLASDVARR